MFMMIVIIIIIIHNSRQLNSLDIVYVSLVNIGARHSIRRQLSTSQLVNDYHQLNHRELRLVALLILILLLLIWRCSCMHLWGLSRARSPC